MKYFKNTSWLFLEKILRLVTGLFIGIWVARYLGPHDFGILSYAISFVGLFSLISGLGLKGIVTRELLKDNYNHEKLISTTFYLQLLGAGIVLIILYMALSLTDNDFYVKLMIYVIGSSTIFQSFNVIDYYFQSKVLSKYVVFSNICSLFFSSIIKILLILNDASLIYFAYVVLFDSIILSLGLIYFFVKKTQLEEISFYFDYKIAINLLKDSWPLIFSGLVISIYMKIDQIMIKEILGANEVGQYAAAVRISEAWYFIPGVIITSLFPSIVNAKKIKDSLYFDRLQKLYDLMVWLAIFIALPMTFLSDTIVNLLYGPEYNEAGTVLMIHIWISVFVFLGLVFSRFLIIENWTKKSFYRTFLGAVLNVIFNFILIPKYGIIGAAIATLLGQIISNYIYDIFDKDLHGQLKMKTKSFIPIHLIKNLILKKNN